MQWTILLAMFLAAGPETPAADAVPYGVASWPVELGNHRAVVQVDRPAEAILVELPWRRRDLEPDKKAVLVFDATTGKPIANAVALRVTAARGEIVFQAATAPGKYYIYYMPLNRPAEESYPQAVYARAQATASEAWRSRAGLTAESLKKEAWRGLPRGKLVAWETVDEYDKFTSMERSASPEEVARLLAADPQALYLVFPEDREHPIRMRDYLPRRWIEEEGRKKGDSPPSPLRNTFAGKACRGEFYAFQIGVFAARGAIADLAIATEDLRPRSAPGGAIPALAIRCFNQGGIDTGGRAFQRPISVDQGKVLALWFGVQVPPNAAPGAYEGAIRLGPQGAPGTRVALRLEIDKAVLADAGDSEPWRHSRLRWLDSTIAADDQPAAPFTPLRVEGRRIACLGRDLELGANGLPTSVRSNFAPEVTRLVTPGRQLLAGPIRFAAELPDGTVAEFAGGTVEFLKQSAGQVVWRSESRAGPLRLRCQAEMEFDGQIAFTMQLTSDRATPVRDLRLEVPLCREVARYMMGMGRPGGLRPAEHKWKWDRNNNQDSLWLGDVNAGLRCRLYGENYRRPVINIHYHHLPLNLPPAWHNEGRGGCSVREEDGGRVVLRATSGARTVLPEQPLHFNFALLLTPLKPLDTDRHWASRYYHAYHAPEQVAQTGANIVNIHHGTEIHPYINYPFLRTDRLKQYVDEAHAKGLKVKVYYTAREQSNRTAELWALRSLGDEVLVPGPGGGHTWLQEHLDPPYVRGWHTPATHDVAFITMADSRWHNYYLEGLDWLVRNVGIDGLYIDDVSYDRTVMKRARKILDRGRPGSQIDLHSWNHFNDVAGHACCLDLYMEHLPYIDRIWIGEGRDYDTPPDYWLVEISGIPFGVMGEMLEKGGNPWRGMIYGMTGRLPYMADPRPIWRVWDDFGMAGSQMIGYWAPDCPVRTDSASVLASVYRKPKKALVVVASWAAQKADCRLTIDFTRLGLDPAKARLRAPAVPGLQPAATFRASDPIPVDPGRGWLLILEEANPSGRLQSLDGRWQIAKDPKDVGKTNRWYTEAGFPRSDSRPILVPGNIYEAWCRYNGLAWYGRTFALAVPTTADMRYYLRFGACEYSCDVWLNGTHLGSHEGASSPFEFDVSALLRPGENFVAVRAFSPGSALWKGSNYPVAFDMGGLTQHVTLAVQPRVRITDVFVRPDWKTGNAPLEIMLENNTGAKAAVTLTGALSEHKSGRPLGTVTAKADVPPGQSVQRIALRAGPPRLWSLEDPFLYSVKVTVDWAAQQDAFAVPHVGFRDFRINEHGYFELNGKRIFPKCTHSNVYDPVSILGTSRDMKYVTPDFVRMKDAGFNMFREIMYSALPEQLDQADELGYLIYNEHQAAWMLRDASKFAVDLPGVIRRDRNHPSLVIWGLLNETPAGPAYDAAKAFLPSLRKLDDTRLVLLGSGRWDKDSKTGSASNPGATTWDVDIGDAHIYPTFPTSWGFVTSMANMANDPRPTFLSEGGIGSSYNAYAEKRKLLQAGAPNDAFAWGWINPMIDGLEKIWAKHKLHEVYPSIEAMLVDSQKLAARERALWFNILRSNPKVNGYSLTGHSDYWGYAEGVTDTFGEFKADHLAAMQAGWAKLKWCLLVHPMNVYADQPFRVRAALANEDRLAPGDYRVKLSIVGPSGEAWRKETVITIRGGVNPPLAYAVLDEDVKPAGLTEGKHALTASLVGVPNASAERLEFTVTDKNKHPDLTKTTITVLGVSPGVKDLLTSRGATLHDYVAGQPIDREVLLVGAGAPNNAAAWRPLYQRIARGAHAVFLAPAALDGGPKSVNKWLAVGKKGTRTRPHEWLYHSDTIARNHPILDGLPAKVMTPDSYGQLLGGEFFSAVADPQQAVAVRLYCTTATTWDGLMVGIYQHHAGKFTINAFDLVGNLGNPAADRMLLNMAAHAAADAAPVQALPAGYDAELNALGIVDDVRK